MRRGGPSEVRRRDRATDDAWIRAFLDVAPFGFLATVGDGRPYLVANLFVYDPDRHVIYLHGAPVGRTRTNLTWSGPVCFSAGVMGRFLPAREAL
ncbi:MAG TPA: pyridoxamine 5'-phosphate oxidase family protein, partial [Longimicrobiales bacterium]|nr:pyridoxamine 5'-phosphate oxidase family protein [Longimicrobiales bacterium]